MSGIFRSRGYSLDQLSMMFYTICIPIRLSLPIIVSYARDIPILKLILIAIGLISAGLNARGIGSGTWWHKKVHLLTAIAFVISLVFPGRIRPEEILFLDVLYGFSSSIAICPFSSKS